MTRIASKTVIGVGFTLLFACGGGESNLPPPPPPPPPAPSSVAPPPPPPVSTTVDAGAAPAPPAVTLLPGAPSPDPTTPLPTAKITAPTKDQVVPGDKASEFAVKLDVKNWPTATGSSHVHLILDNKPYKAIYDPKQPVKLSELSYGAAVEEGHHVLVAFPSRANHESVKTKDALSIVEFFVGKKSDKKTDIKKPLLIYSRPKGDYKGDMASHVLIDFQVANVTLAEGKEHVNIAVTGPGIDKELTAKVEKFGTPFYLDNLQNGSYTVKLDLVGGDNQAIAGPWNSTSREIKVDHDAPSDMPMPAATPAPAAADAGAAPPPAKPKAPPPKK